MFQKTAHVQNVWRKSAPTCTRSNSKRICSWKTLMRRSFASQKSTQMNNITQENRMQREVNCKNSFKREMMLASCCLRMDWGRARPEMSKFWLRFCTIWPGKERRSRSLLIWGWALLLTWARSSRRLKKATRLSKMRYQQIWTSGWSQRSTGWANFSRITLFSMISLRRSNWLTLGSRSTKGIQ
jgi:hypothetical protein